MSSVSPPPTFGHSRPVPRRLLSLQNTLGHADLNVFPSTPSPPSHKLGDQQAYGYAYPSPVTSPDSPKAPVMTSATLKRPGGPRRAHSFCGDASANTFALASTKAGSNLSSDKCSLVAPGLERTISSQGSPRGSQANLHPYHGFPSCSQMLPTPPTSPPSSPAIPTIMISDASPSRPSLSTIQPARPRTNSRPPPFRIHSGSTNSSVSSRTTSYTISTPSLDPIEDETESHNWSSPTRPRGSAKFGADSMDMDTEEDDMMVVDGMIHQVGDLSLGH